MLANFYWIMIAAYLVDLFVFRVPISAVCSLLIILVFVLDLIASRGRILLDATALYFLWMIVSGFFAIAYGFPMILFIQAVAYMAIPVIMYSVKKHNIAELYKRYMGAILASIMIAILMYYCAPDFYGRYLLYHHYQSGSSRDYIRLSMQGLYGITMLASFSAICSIYFFGKWLEKPQLRSLLKFGLALFTLVFTGRRSAVAGGLLLIIVIVIRYFHLRRKFGIKQVFVISFVVIVLIISIVANYEVVSFWIKRMTGLSLAISERNSNWIEVFESLGSRIILGQGLGTAGHNAGAMGYLGAFDSSYVLLISELGIVGLLVFLLCLVKSFYRFFMVKHNERNWFALYIVVLFLIQAIGSNVWEFPVLASLFWFSLSAMSVSKNA